MNPHPHSSVNSIRRRLNLLLLRAFLVVVLLITGLFWVMTTLSLSLSEDDTSIFSLALPAILESYYQGRGSWDGVEELFGADDNVVLEALNLQWQQATLLDRADQPLFVDGKPALGAPLPEIDSQSKVIPLVVNDQQVGSLLRMVNPLPLRLRVIASVLLPVIFISIFLGLLTMFIGMLLTRRVVSPLAEVIAASQEVAGGDLSARVKVQGPDDLRALTDSFNQMAGSLERSQDERRNLLADIAHELRTPLTVIRGKLEGILDGVYPADEAHVAPVLEETYLLECLVEDLRLLTLAETGQLHFDLKALDLGELAAQAEALFEAQAAEKGITLQVEIPPDLSLARGDAQRTAQVVGNLLSNALEFTPQGGVVQVSVSAVLPSPSSSASSAALDASPAGVRLAVLDSGPGVPGVDLERIFDRFWRSDKSRARQTGGSGLGLAIVRQLVEAQGGSVYAENRAEGGLEVGFVLPRA